MGNGKGGGLHLQGGRIPDPAVQISCASCCCQVDDAPYEPAPQEYRIKVETGKKSGNGTNANISIVLIGSEGQTDALLLDEPEKNNFAKGQVSSTRLSCGS